MPSPLRIKTALNSQRRFGGSSAANTSPPQSPSPHSAHVTPAMVRGPGFHDHGTVHHVITTHRTASVPNPEAEPVYEHGHETFGDMIANPFKQMRDHRDRIKKFEEAKERYEKKKSTKRVVNKDMESSLEVGENEKKVEIPMESIFIIHFRRLTDGHSFTLTPEQRQKIENEVRISYLRTILAYHQVPRNDTFSYLDYPHHPRTQLHMTPQERELFANVTDSDTLVEFFDKTGRESAMKIHTRDENEKEAKEKKEAEEKAAKDLIDHADGRTLNDPGPVVDLEGPHSIILELSSNMFIEIKKLNKEQLEEEEEEDMITRRPFFATPDIDLSDNIGEEKSASWLELFYDLFYIASLSEFTHSHHIVSLGTLGQYTGWFVVLWWSWTASSLFDTNDVVHHLYKLVEMCGVVGMAGASSNYLTAPAGFIIGYMGKSVLWMMGFVAVRFSHRLCFLPGVSVLKAILVLEYVVVFATAAIFGSKSRGALGCYVIVNIIALILWGASLKLLPEGEKNDSNTAKRLSLWYLSIVLEIIVNVALKDSKRVSLAASHIAERFGLLTLIVLGENLMGFVKMVAEAGLAHQVVYVIMSLFHPTFELVRLSIANMLAVVIIFGLFFMYFDDFSKEILAETDLNQIWMYLHFPLHLCQVAFGIALTDTILLYDQSLSSGGTTAGATSHGAALVSSILNNVAESTNTTTDIANTTTAVASNATTTQTETAILNSEVASEGSDSSFVFKTFLISGGLIMTLNAFIKLLHTELNHRLSVVICGSRIVNSIVLWALVTLPFKDMSPIVLICIMTGSVVIQGMIDLLD
ncbi:bacterial low temperature requirement A protein-domain-containing protein [Jimgerdemannia flammicorona]|uniref:Bacterial low temperature requirement A protein-domain-containing protein n=1 Tax=Jimgerdemannia flammicorona TaxID=994334 RepID=A0A433D9L0_9FUNG|nr:bacterial low temperature requirement A protein-domain-containing protein [Jimgerdemannia flammicorona]